MEFALCLLSPVLHKFLAKAFLSILYHTDMRMRHLLPDHHPGEAYRPVSHTLGTLTFNNMPSQPYSLLSHIPGR